MVKKEVYTLNALKKDLHDWKGLSGNYQFIRKSTMERLYVGKTSDLCKRMMNYLNYEEEVKGSYVNNRLGNDILNTPDDLIIQLYHNSKCSENDNITFERWQIISHCPIYNQDLNPRHSIKAIHLMIVRVIIESNRDWSYVELKHYLLNFWGDKVGKDIIEIALKDPNNHMNKESWNDKKVSRSKHKNIHNKVWKVA